MTFCKKHLLIPIFALTLLLIFGVDSMAQRNIFDQVKKVENVIQNQELHAPFSILPTNEESFRDIQSSVPSAIFMTNIFHS